MVTHEQSDCDTIAAKVYRMDEGLLVQEDKKVPAEAG
jgi:ABC-type sulfate/molybdate transport systems ATPase subunit